MRGGGTTSVSAEELDELFAFLAANVDVRGSRTSVAQVLIVCRLILKRRLVYSLTCYNTLDFKESKLESKKTVSSKT